MYIRLSFSVSRFSKRSAKARNLNRGAEGVAAVVISHAAADSGGQVFGAVQAHESEAGINMRIVIVMSGAGPELPTFR